MTQKAFADLAQMAQPRISAMERPGATGFNVETLVRLAAALKVGLIVKFVPFSEMLAWENGFSQDQFDVVPVDQDTAFLYPPMAAAVPINNMTVAALRGSLPIQDIETFTRTRSSSMRGVQSFARALNPAGTADAPPELVAASQQVGGQANAAFGSNPR